MQLRLAVVAWGVIRLSGPKSYAIAEALTQKALPKARFAGFRQFYDAAGEVMDEGLAICFPNPNSFTGEDVVELQGHGGPVIQNALLGRLLELGAIAAKAGEFSMRAFENGKLDLVQAEAIADLIDATSQAAARSAVRSLQGAFSTRVNTVLEKLIHLRMCRPLISQKKKSIFWPMVKFWPCLKMCKVQ